MALRKVSIKFIYLSVVILIIFNFQNCSQPLDDSLDTTDENTATSTSTSTSTSLDIEDLIIDEGSGGIAILNRLNNFDNAESYQWAIESAAINDFSLITGVVTFNAGEANVQIPLNSLNNDTFDGSRGYTVTITNSSDSSINKTFKVNIIDDEGLPAITITGGVVTEGQFLNFVLNLNRSSLNPISVGVKTENVTALMAIDYEDTIATVTFAPGELTKTVSVQTIDDKIVKESRSFLLKLENPTNSQLGVMSAVGTINDNDLGKAIATGWQHSCGVFMGSALCWGRDYYGELGMEQM